VGTWCAASEDEPQTLRGKPSWAWEADHPASEEAHEAAHERHERAYEALLAVRRALQDAEDTLHGAEADLARTEYQPGIPLYVKARQIAKEHTA
jgi:hypothetical protein